MVMVSAQLQRCHRNDCLRCTDLTAGEQSPENAEQQAVSRARKFSTPFHKVGERS